MNEEADHQHALSTQAKPSGLSRFNTLRFQFTLVIFLLAFVPNAILTFSAGRDLGLLGRAALPLGLWLGLVAVFSAVVGWVLSGALLRPLSRLAGELGRGEFHPAQNALGRMNVDDPQEVRALRAAFSGLLDRLGTEQGRRSAFMATLVHDLKTPLVATGHLIRTLSKRPLPDLERHALGEHLLTENARLLGLVQQMADAHRFEREDVRLTSAETDLRALLDRVALRLQQGRVVPGVPVVVSGEGLAVVDAAVLERAVANLADNAARYASRRLELRVDPDGVSVCDDGPGLPEGASIASLAQPFNAQPVEIAGHKYTAGTAGLGLYIVRRIAEAHGGELVYRRESAEGQPALSVMHIQLPEIFGVSSELSSVRPVPEDPGQTEPVGELPVSRTSDAAPPPSLADPLAVAFYPHLPVAASPTSIPPLEVHP